MKDERSVPEKVSQEIIKEIQETTAGRNEAMKDLNKSDIVNEIACAKYEYMPIEMLLRYSEKTHISEYEHEFIRKKLKESNRMKCCC